MAETEQEPQQPKDNKHIFRDVCSYILVTEVSSARCWVSCDRVPACTVLRAAGILRPGGIPLHLPHSRIGDFFCNGQLPGKHLLVSQLFEPVARCLYGRDTLG